jgi:hypothetical protein
MDVFYTELGIWLSFVKTSEFFLFGLEFEPPPPPVCHWEVANSYSQIKFAPCIYYVYSHVCLKISWYIHNI